jgi:hypothetical protein
LLNLELGEPEMKIYKAGISFNRAAQKLLALKLHSKFILVKEDGILFYEDSIKEGFEITHVLEKGGCRLASNILFKYLFPEKTESVVFKIGEFKEGRRRLQNTNPLVFNTKI